MSAKDAKSNAFFRAFDDASREEQAALIAETEEYKKRELNAAREKAQQKYDEYILNAAADFAAADGIEAEKRAFELKTEVLSTRQGITERVFAAAKKKLEAFTKTSEYGVFLKNSVSEMVKLCGESPLTVFVKEDDFSFSSELQKISASVTVKTDSSIEIGGAYGICEEEHIKLNDLLETRLNAQKDWFYENSGLSLKTPR